MKEKLKDYIHYKLLPAFLLESGMIGFAGIVLSLLNRDAYIAVLSFILWAGSMRAYREVFWYRG